MKNLKILQFLLFSLLVICFAACDCESKNNDDNGKVTQSSPLVGRWEYNNTAFIFNSDKSGCHETDLNSEGLSVRKSHFTWESTGTHLLLTYDGSGGHGEGDFAYSYILENDLLTIYYSDGVLMGIYKKTANKTENDSNSNNNGPTVSGNINGYDYADLGLSVKWATCNVGASKPEDYGGYYAWGETEEKENYDLSTYKHRNEKEFTNIGSDISGTPYDVAHVKWGGSWRMPTKTEQDELCTRCTWTWTTLNGINGCHVTGPNGNSIFLPAAGCRESTNLKDRGWEGNYWSGASGNGNLKDDKYFLGFDEGGGYLDCTIMRYYGHSVRPIIDK